MDINVIRQYSENAEVAAKGEEKMQQILTRSATDAEFRRKLIEDPRAALREVLGADVPESFNVKFVENKADATIVLPEYVDTSAQLSEEQLESVAGGSEPISTTLIVAGVLGAIAGGIALGVEVHKAMCEDGH